MCSPLFILRPQVIAKSDGVVAAPAAAPAEVEKMEKLTLRAHYHLFLLELQDAILGHVGSR